MLIKLFALKTKWVKDLCKKGINLNTPVWNDLQTAFNETVFMDIDCMFDRFNSAKNSSENLFLKKFYRETIVKWDIKGHLSGIVKNAESILTNYEKYNLNN